MNSMAAWGWWNGLLLGLAHAATRIGKSRTYETLDHSQAEAPTTAPATDTSSWVEQPSA